MADEKATYEVEAKFAGEGALRRAAAEFDRLADKVKAALKENTIAPSRGTSMRWTELSSALDVAGQAFSVVSQRAQQVYAAMREGAQLITTTERFGKLAAQIDTTADALLGKMRTATKGMIADAELMASASGIVSLRLADNEEQVVRLSTVVGTLGWDMQQVILTFANLSTMRLDALGLSVEEVKTKQKELEAQGYSTAAAFKEAVIQAGEMRLGVGGVSELEEAVKRLEAQVVNASNAFKEQFATGIAEALDEVLPRLEAVGVGLDDVTGAIGKKTGSILGEQLAPTALAIEMDDLKKQLADVLGSTEAAEGAFARLVRAQNLAGIAQHGLIDGFFSATVATENQTAVIEELIQIIDQMRIVQLLGGDGWQDYSITTAEYSEMAAAAVADDQRAMRKEMMATFALAAGFGGGGLGWAGGRFGEPAPATPLVSTRTSAWGDARQRQREANTAYVRHDTGFLEQGAAARRSMAYDTAAVYSYGSALSSLSTEEQKAAEAHQSFMSAFNQELRAKPEDGLYDASGVANVEAVNKALYEQVEAAGASAATLAMLGVATGQFTQEQAEAALKAAVLQEQIKAIAAAVVAGDLGIGEALGQLGQVREALDTANLQSAITGAGGPLDETQTQLDTLTDAEHQVTLDMNIQQVIDGTTEAGRLIDTLPTTRTMTIRWEQAGADVIAALRALGIIV